MTLPPTEPLQVFDCPLDGIRLVEASAGTGKTWNICALYLRLLLERGIEAPGILVVTFSIAATGELRDRIRDRLKYTLDNKPIGHKVPYLQGPGRIHFCCRSTETLVTKSWRELGIDVDEMDAGTRASMDGQVAAQTTYSEWLSQQSLYRQVQVLGDTRARLLQNGGMKVPDFFSDKGEWITLNKLKEIDAAAFEKAGF